MRRHGVFSTSFTGIDSKEPGITPEHAIMNLFDSSQYRFQGRSSLLTSRWCRCAIALTLLGACGSPEPSDDPTPTMSADDMSDQSLDAGHGEMRDGGEMMDLSTPDLGTELAGDQGLDLSVPDMADASDASMDEDADMGSPQEEMGPEDMAMEPSGCESPLAWHVSPNGSGMQDGSSVQDAAPIAQLDDLITNRGEGRNLFCLHAGSYPANINLRRGGTEMEPVILRGEEGTLFEDTFVANATNKFGASALIVRASHLVIESIRCERVGQCVKVPTTEGLVVEDLTLRNLYIEHVGTAIDVARSGKQEVRDLTIQDVMILQYSRGGIFLGSDTEGVLLEDIYIDMQPEEIGGRGSDYPVGIALFDETRDVKISRATVLNSLGKTDGYSQGDGIDGERSATHVEVSDSFFAGHRDGCIDTKSRHMVIRDTTVVNCKRNLRLWQNDEGNGPRCERCTSYQPRDAHIFTKGSTPAYLDDLSVYSDNDAKLVVLDGPGEVVIDGLSGTLSAPDRLNASMVTNSTLAHGQSFMTPAPPNTTSFVAP